MIEYNYSVIMIMLIILKLS